MCMSSGDTFACGSCATYLFFYQILESKCIVRDLLLNRRTATWNLFFKYLRRNEAAKRENDQIGVNLATNEGRADGTAHGGTSAQHSGTPREYSSKQLKHSIVKRILVFKR